MCMRARLVCVDSQAEQVVLADREKRYPVSPSRMFEVLVDERDCWVHLRQGEVAPRVLGQDRPHRMTWSSLWPVSPRDRIDFYLRAAGDGSAVRFVWTSDQPPDDRGVGLVRQHLNEMLGGDLRGWLHHLAFGGTAAETRQQPSFTPWRYPQPELDTR